MKIGYKRQEFIDGVKLIIDQIFFVDKTWTDIPDCCTPFYLYAVHEGRCHRVVEFQIKSGKGIDLDIANICYLDAIIIIIITTTTYQVKAECYT